jgi:hypothetical protein
LGSCVQSHTGPIRQQNVADTSADWWLPCRLPVGWSAPRFPHAVWRPKSLPGATSGPSVCPALVCTAAVFAASQVTAPVIPEGGATPYFGRGLTQPRPTGVAPPSMSAQCSTDPSSGTTRKLDTSAPMREHAEVLGHVKASLAALAAGAALTCPARFRGPGRYRSGRRISVVLRSWPRQDR